MINDNIHPIDPTGFRFPTETEMAIDETLKLCGVSGEDASMIAMEVMKKLGKSDEVPACCGGLAEKRLKSLPSAQPEIIRCKDCKYAEVADKEDGQDGYTCQFHRGSIWFSGSYCSWAERREE